MTTASVLPASGWKNHSEQSDDAALAAGAWGITTELVSGIVVMSRLEGGHVFKVRVFERHARIIDHNAPTIEEVVYHSETAKARHYHYVTLLVDYGKITHDYDQAL